MRRSPAREAVRSMPSGCLALRLQRLDDLRTVPSPRAPTCSVPALTARGPFRSPGSRTMANRQGRAASRTPPGSPSPTSARDAGILRARHPDVFAPGRVVLNRFPFMAAPAHLLQLIAQQGGGVAIPAGNINWDVPLPACTRAGTANRGAGARRHADRAGRPRRDRPRVRPRHARVTWRSTRSSWAAPLASGAPAPAGADVERPRDRALRLDRDDAARDVVRRGDAAPRAHARAWRDSRCDHPRAGGRGRRGPARRHDARDRRQPPGPARHRRRRAPPSGMRCGDPRPAILVLGRAAEVVTLAGRKFHAHALLDAAATAADVLDSAVFFVVVLRDRLLVRVEVRGPPAGNRWRRCTRRWATLPVELETVAPETCSTSRLLGRSPHVYKPVVLSDWTRPGRRILTVGARG